MSGKRYSKEEIRRIVELKNSGLSFSDLRNKIKEEFSTDRPERALKVIYNRHKNQESAQVGSDSSNA